MAPLRRVVSGESGEDTAQAKTKKKRRGKKGAPDEEQEWARQGRGMRRGENTQMRLMLIGGTALFVLIVAGMIFATKSGKSSVNVPDLKSVSVEKNGSVTAPQAVRRSEAVIAYEAKVLAEKFTQATRVEAILPLVRHPEVAEARVRKFYPDGKIPVVGIALFNSGGAPVSHGSIVSFNIRTGDQEEKTMTFIDGPQGLKIDWESWVGWSDISWADFLSNKPSDAHVFRVTLAPIDYYN
ncbi:MAG: hypothetical protein ABI162_04285, partial [Luteolibacter sp.]